MSRLVASPDAGVFAALADSEAFNRVFVALGAVCWPDGLDRRECVLELTTPAQS
jgi:hypothetical protein